MTQSILDALAHVKARPSGRDKVRALEELVDRADAEDDPHAGTATRLALVFALYYVDDDTARWAPFSWVLRRTQEQPPWFDEQMRHDLMWVFKWMVPSMLTRPDVPLERIEAVMAAMTEHYRRAGEGLHPVLRLRQRVTEHVHGAQAADEAWRAARQAPRTRLSDCQACEPTSDALHLVRLGDLDGAVRLAVPVLDGQVSCGMEPEGMVSVVLPALLATGRAERAGREHVRAVRTALSKEAVAWTLPTHVRVCAQAGQPARGLDVLEDAFVALQDSTAPSNRMRLAAAGARLLRDVVDGGAGDEQVRVRDRQVPAAALLDELRHEARAFAAAFDARNGTATVSTEVEGWIDAPELPELPLRRVSVRRRRHVAVEPARSRARSGSPAPSPSPEGTPPG